MCFKHTVFFPFKKFFQLSTSDRTRMELFFKTNYFFHIPQSKPKHFSFFNQSPAEIWESACFNDICRKPFPRHKVFFTKKYISQKRFSIKISQRQEKRSSEKEQNLFFSHFPFFKCGHLRKKKSWFRNALYATSHRATSRCVTSRDGTRRSTWPYATIYATVHDPRAPQGADRRGSSARGHTSRI